MLAQYDRGGRRSKFRKVGHDFIAGFDLFFLRAAVEVGGVEAEGSELVELGATTAGAGARGGC